jgi:membrane associated rhomboid family serine protease
MSQKDVFRFTPEVVMYPLFFVLLMWICFWAEIRFGMRFTRWGIYPLEWKGLKGILFGPLVHGSLKHLFNNSVPLFVLTAALFYFYRTIRWRVLFIGLILTGIATWLFARPAWHIGASGVIYMLAAFLFFKGIFSRRYQLIALSLIVVFLYGGMLWYLFPIDPKISWEGHMSGFGVGLLLSVIFWKSPIEKKKYEWEKETYDPDKDPFLQHFDEHGNFIPQKPLETPVSKAESPPQRVRIVYQYRDRNKEEE